MSPGVGAPLGSPIARGRTAEIYSWQEDQILKLLYAWCPPGWIEQELEANRVIAATAIPAPELTGTVEIDGRRGAIYRKVTGPSMLSLVKSKPWRVVQLARQLAELHTEIHRHCGSGLPSLRPSLRAAIERTEHLPPGLRADALRLLQALPDGEALCHFDFHPDQVLITAGGPAILDWMTARQGHPVADVARTAILLTVGQVPNASLATRMVVGLWRGLFGRTYMSRYLKLHPGVTMDEIRRWMVPVAAARLDEGIAGERESLLRLVRSGLANEKGVR